MTPLVLRQHRLTTYPLHSPLKHLLTQSKDRFQLLNRFRIVFLEETIQREILQLQNCSVYFSKTTTTFLATKARVATDFSPSQLALVVGIES